MDKLKARKRSQSRPHKPSLIRGGKQNAHDTEADPTRRMALARTSGGNRIRDATGLQALRVRQNRLLRDAELMWI
jgi:hypothetical protein